MQPISVSFDARVCADRRVETWSIGQLLRVESKRAKSERVRRKVLVLDLW